MGPQPSARGGPGAARPAQPVQLAALPGYLSDEDIVPARPAQSVQLAALPGYLSDEDIVPAPPAQSAQLAALPGYLSDEDIVPARPAGSALGLLQPVPRKPAEFAGIPSRRPEPALAPVRVNPPLRAESYTLADLVEDQAWRQRTSRQLKRLFQ